MRGGRFKVFDDVSNDWWEEFRLYHRKGGRVVKENDDLLCATRYGIMMLRHARTPEAYNNFHRKIEMPALGRPDEKICCPEHHEEATSAYRKSQFIVGMSAPTSWGRGRGVRSGPRSLGDRERPRLSHIFLNQ